MFLKSNTRQVGATSQVLSDLKMLRATETVKPELFMSESACCWVHRSAFVYDFECGSCSKGFCSILPWQHTEILIQMLHTTI